MSATSPDRRAGSRGTAPPDLRLFRSEALDDHLQPGEGAVVVRVSAPWTWSLLWVVLLALAAAAVASIVGEVEVSGRGRGILRPTGGVRLLVAQLPGTVSEVGAHSGQAVRAGDALLRIDSPGVQGQLLEAERNLEAVRTDYAAISSRQDRHHGEQIERLGTRARRLEEQIASFRKSTAFHERRLQADSELQEKGLASPLAVAESGDALEQVQRQLSAAELALDQTQQELASLQGRRQEELWQRRQVLNGALNRSASLAFVLNQTAIRAPEDGTVEALLVRLGETVQAGQAVGKVIARGSALHVVSFLAERDRAFVQPGDEVHLELDQLPYGEYGTVRARVSRISGDLASPYEVREALGEDQKLDSPTYRVELDVVDARAAEAARVSLRTGMLMNVRYTLRRQRVATLWLEPLRKWLR